MRDRRRMQSCESCEKLGWCSVVASPMRRQMSIRVFGTVLSALLAVVGCSQSDSNYTDAMIMETHKGYFIEGAALLVHPFSPDSYVGGNNASVFHGRTIGTSLFFHFRLRVAETDNSRTEEKNDCRFDGFIRTT